MFVQTCRSTSIVVRPIVGVAYLWVCKVGVSILNFLHFLFLIILQYCNYQGTYVNISNILSSS